MVDSPWQSRKVLPYGRAPARTQSLERIATGEFERVLNATEAAALADLLEDDPAMSTMLLPASFPLFIHSLPSGVVVYAHR